MNSEPPDSIDEFGRFDDRYWRGESNASDRHSEPAEIFAVDLNHTVLRCGLYQRVVNPSEHALEFCESGPDGECRVLVAGCRTTERAGDETRRIAARDLPWHEMVAHWPGLPQPVQSKCSPVATIAVPGHEIPTTSHGDKLVWLDEPSAAFSVTSPVVKTHVLVVAAGRGEHTECFRIDDVVVG